MNRIILIVTLVLHAIIADNLYAQDFHYSQYFNAPMTLNPALTGSKDLRIINNYKKQWNSISPKMFTTNAISADIPFYNQQFGGGIIFINDKAGTAKFGSTHILGSLSTNIELTDFNKFYVGFTGGYIQHSLNTHILTWDSQFTGNGFDNNLPSMETFNSPNFGYFDISTGVLWENYTIARTIVRTGFAAWHVNMPKFSYYNKNKRDIKYTLHSEAEYSVKSTNTTYYPSILIASQGRSLEILAGMNVKYKLGFDSRYTQANTANHVMFGAHYRYHDAVILYIAYTYHRSFTFAFSYDINISKLNIATNGGGGGEICISYQPYSKARKRLHIVN